MCRTCSTLIFAHSTNHSLSGHVVAVAVSDANTLRKALKITVSVMSTTMFTRTRSIPRQNLHLEFLKIRAACLSVVYNNSIIFFQNEELISDCKKNNLRFVVRSFAFLSLFKCHILITYFRLLEEHDSKCVVLVFFSVPSRCP